MAARHAEHAEWWLKTIPNFYEMDESGNAVFNPLICLVQVAHYYLIGGDDPLGMQNANLFSGFGILRALADAFTSCGTVSPARVEPPIS